jgi:hypothetical protein
LVAVLAGILKIDSDSIRVLRVYSGSIVLVFVMPESAAYRLQELAIKGDFRLKKADLFSVQLDGEDIVYFSRSETDNKTNIPLQKERSQPVGGNTFNIEGGVHAGRDVVMGDQTKTVYQTTQTFNITTPAQFVDELNKLKEEIEKLKSQPDVDKPTSLRMELAQAEIETAMEEAKKEQPTAERIKNTLDSAKEVMNKIGGGVTSAINLGTTLGNLALLALKVFGG